MAKRSWAVLRSDKSLAWFPVFSFLGSLVVIGVVAGLIAATGVDSGGSNDSLEPIAYVFIVLGYIGLAFVQTYFLAALVAGADTRLHGGQSSLSSALQIANSRLHRLLPWALVTATVTIILQAIEERFGVVGRIVASLVGLAWNLVTFLTIPILVLEDIGVGAALTRSKDLFKKTWGENVVGQAGLGIIGFLAALPGVALVAIGAGIGTAGLIVFGAIGVAWIVVATTVIAALSGIYRTVLYRFAANGEIPQEFADINLQSAFRPRGNDGGTTGGGFGGGFAGFSRN